MPYEKLNEALGKLSGAKDEYETAEAGVAVVNELLKILGADAGDLKYGEDALDKVLPNSVFPNEKVKTWFSKHPYLPNNKVALDFYTDENVEVKFYWLSDNATKARISAGVMLTPNWEDSDLTRNENYKVGIDFFMPANAGSVMMVVSLEGNLRVLEFGEKLSNTQVEILNSLKGVLAAGGRSEIHYTLWNSLALSEVNKKFYAGIAEHFNILLSHLKKNGKDEEDAKLFSSRLLGRLLFLWFLRKKNIIDESQGYFDLPDGNATEYYEKVLKPLFFETLNQPAELRKTKDKKTPYLNGGLFEPHENDWYFSEVDFPAGYFNGLYEHLEKYNFTTDESSPEYEQVAIDPEMLGRVFESLLATQSTATGEQARKAKGAFYTPREIVSYMCKEALRQYLYGKLGNPAFNGGIDMLLDKTDPEWEVGHSNSKRDLWPDSNRDELIRKTLQALDELKVLDPACGSGAFPMGMLQLLMKTYARLDSRYDLYKIKLRIIEENLYGVDIEPMAVEISRLRAWLAIIIDDDSDVDPLPNLDFKFVCADSLVPLEEQTGLYADNSLDEKLTEIRHRYFKARKPQKKKEYQNEYYSYVVKSDMFAGKRDEQLKTFDPFKGSQPASFLDTKFMFGVEKFDVVIGNPPYVHLEKMKEKAAAVYKPLDYKTYAARGDLYALFYERGLDLLNDGGTLVFITSNKWMRAGYGAGLRDYFVENTQPVLLVDLGGGVFESATVDTNILVLRKSEYEEDTICVAASKDLSSDNMSDYIKQHRETIRFKTGESWAILNEIERSIKAKIEKYGTPLRDWDIQINYGIKTGCNEAFIINEERRQEILDHCSSEEERVRTDKLIRPILRGRDIKRNEVKFSGLYLINTHNGYTKDTGEEVPRVDIDEYPAVKSWLESEEWNTKPQKGTAIERLQNRTDKGDTMYNLRDCAYMDDFTKQKIIWSDIATEPNFIQMDEEIYFNNTCYMITGAPAWMADYLNSDFIKWYFPNVIATDLGSGARYFKQFVEIIPIPRKYNPDTFYSDMRLSEEEIKFISSSVSP